MPPPPLTLARPRAEMTDKSDLTGIPSCSAASLILLLNLIQKLRKAFFGRWGLSTWYVDRQRVTG